MASKNPNVRVKKKQWIKIVKLGLDSSFKSMFRCRIFFGMRDRNLWGPISMCRFSTLYMMVVASLVGTFLGHHYYQRSDLG